MLKLQFHFSEMPYVRDWGGLFFSVRMPENGLCGLCVQMPPQLCDGWSDLVFELLQAVELCIHAMHRRVWPHLFRAFDEGEEHLPFFRFNVDVILQHEVPLTHEKQEDGPA